jgi:sugar phosphate isomerase/epimerase
MKVRLLLVTFMLMDNAMNIGLWTGFYLLERRHLGSLETVIKNVSRIRRAGFSCGELDERNAWELFVDTSEQVCDTNAKALKKLKFFTQLHAPKPLIDNKAQEFVEKRIIESCEKMGVRTIVTHPILAQHDQEEPKTENILYLQKFCEKASLFGIRVALENQIHPVDYKTCLSKIPILGVTIDFAHALASGLDEPTMIDDFGPRLYGLHVSDSDGKSEDYHIMPGRGSINWSAVMEKLFEHKYSGDIHLEIVHERSDCPDVNDKTAAIAFEAISRLVRKEKMIKNNRKDKGRGL